VIDEPAAMAAKKRALSSGGTRRLVPIKGVYYFLFDLDFLKTSLV
jgi:hypothetical protein